MIDNTFDLYCKIYLDTDLDRDLVLSTITGIVGGEHEEYFSLVNDIFNLDVIRNDDFHELRRNAAPDGFLFSRYLLDIEPNEHIDSDTYINMVACLLEGLWRLGKKAVASCDFEDMLPNRGGFNSDNRK